MNFEAYSYFAIILSGFVAVWTYRHFVKSQAKITEFEYLGWSAFWGLIIIVLFQLWAKLINFNTPAFNEIFKNPFATGLLMSILGLVGGMVTGLVIRDIKKSK